MDRAAQSAQTVEPHAAWRPGQLTYQVRGVDSIEVKMTLAGERIDSFLERLHLANRDAEKRNIYFFDTRKLELLNAGVIARTRWKNDGQHDATVKFRPAEPDKKSKCWSKWSKFKGFKLEADASERDISKSASLSLSVAQNRIDEFMANEKKIRPLFKRKHFDFLKEIGGDVLREAVGRTFIDFESLTVFGPIKGRVWEVRRLAKPWPVAAPWEVTAELWQRWDKDRLMELSMKCAARHAAFAIGGFEKLLEELGVDRDKEAKSKTKWALVRDPARP